MTLVTIQVIGAALVVAPLGMEYGRSRRSEQIIRAWAEQNYYRLIEARNMFFFAGPFLWAKSGAQTVFRVSIYDGSGVTKSAWLLCGTWWGRFASSDIKVRWDN